MTDEMVIEQVRKELLGALDAMRTELDRIEILSAAVCGFSLPVPDYEPTFRHVHNMGLTAYQL